MDKRSGWRWYDDAAFLICLALIAAVICILFALPGKAADGHHGHGHDKLHTWYKTLMRPDFPESPCCNDQDCRPTQARLNAGRWQALKDGTWITIPQSKINREESYDSQAHICAPSASNDHYPRDFVFCFVKPGAGI